MFNSFASCLTPPSDASPASVLDTARNIFQAQSRTVAHLENLYIDDKKTQDQFVKSLQFMHNALLINGKIVITGMGKSYKIADKLVATMNSLGIHAVPLHPSDALHGDLGIIKPSDVIIFITASGNTPEIINLLPHIPEHIPKICLTCRLDSTLAKASSAILSAQLPDELSESNIYGLPAPTTSTTACLVVGDAVCITLAEILVSDQKQRRNNFGKWHPGGAIGQDYERENTILLSRNGSSVSLNSNSLKIEDIGHFNYDCANLNEIALLRSCTGKNWICFNSTDLVSTKDISNLIQSDTWSDNNVSSSAHFQIMETQLPKFPIESLDRFYQSQLLSALNNDLESMSKFIGKILLVIDDDDQIIGLCDIR
ncbi:SIS domain-containing protein [Nadsonia fulvescens var. elongata DSM 6958]|uniref:SIS domain-containing protein n=1 Tax=Nadsonia fulvescens var. elongata DSM 6958 TaxID=857566 RepID=A0A1E3PDK5_9ASCO|nr:SIS domain-containing protein [Nadsonia fulvescens var. elongata DSM 6958]